MHSEKYELELENASTVPLPLTETRQYPRAIGKDAKLQYETLNDFSKLRKDFPECYRTWYETKDPDCVGFVQLPKYLSISNREKFIHLQRTMRDLEIAKIDTRGPGCFTREDNIVYYLSAILKLPISAVLDSLQRQSPRYLIESAIRSRISKPDALPTTHPFRCYRDFPSHLIDSMAELVGNDEGLLIVALCISMDPRPRDSLYNVILAHECPESVNHCRASAQQTEEDLFNKIMSDLNADIERVSMKEKDGGGFNTGSKGEKKDKEDGMDSPLKGENMESLSAGVLSGDDKDDESAPVSNDFTDEFIAMSEQQYNQFVLDEQDLDPEFIEMVEKLTDFFPTFPKTELKVRLKLSENWEGLIEELFFETEQNEIKEQEEMLLKQEEDDGDSRRSSKYSDDVYNLHEMLPHISLPVISRKLEENHGDAQLASLALLNQPAQSQFASVRGSSRSNVNEWHQISSMVTRIKEFLHVNNESDHHLNDPGCIGKCFLEDDDIIHYVRKSGGNYYDALSGIIMNCRPKIQKEVVVRKRVGGRVQRGGGGSRGNNAPSVREMKQVKVSYSYNPHASESLELWQIYKSNRVMHTIDKSLLINALEFFNGDCNKVIELAFQLSQEPRASFSASSMIKPKPVRFAPKLTTDPYLQLSQKLRAYSAKQKAKAPASASASASSVQIERLDKYITSAELDLHNFKLVDALRTTKLVLSHWWDEEMRLRIEQGQMQKYGQLARFVGEITIITGRGLHSVGGVSMIRKFVKDYLVRQHFIFDEGLGKFDVKGKKKTGRM
ncbi:uncharacterized protein LODBEIA_P55270 [Lodderomyces beijingensis]|uniref:Smr domain-containing protein n=1 Tax=Lodderomyces beijingensis TaxID=1775926 RepID=A0ABP0ZT48_9ASCO